MALDRRPARSPVLHAATDHPARATPSIVAAGDVPNPGWFAISTPELLPISVSPTGYQVRGKPSLGAAQSSSCYGKSTVALERDLKIR